MKLSLIFVVVLLICSWALSQSDGPHLEPMTSDSITFTPLQCRIDTPSTIESATAHRVYRKDGSSVYMAKYAHTFALVDVKKTLLRTPGGAVSAIVTRYEGRWFQKEFESTIKNWKWDSQANGDVVKVVQAYISSQRLAQCSEEQQDKFKNAVVEIETP